MSIEKLLKDLQVQLSCPEKPVDDLTDALLNQQKKIEALACSIEDLLATVRRRCASGD